MSAAGPGELSPAEWSAECEESLSAFGRRLEDRGHDDSVELALTIAGRAIVAAVRELAAEVRDSRPAVGEVADAVDGAAHHLEQLGKVLSDGR